MRPGPAREKAVESMKKQRCTALTAAGRACQAWAVRGSEPPRCSAHGGGNPGARQQEREAALGEEIVVVRRLLWRLVEHLEEHPELGLQEMALIASMLLDTTRTMARLLRDERALRGETAEGIAGAIGQALDELAVEWGLDE